MTKCNSHHYNKCHSHYSNCHVRKSCKKFVIPCIPYTICEEGEYHVTQDFTASAGNAITVNVSNVCIEFCCDAKLTLTGPSTKGIYIAPVENVQIINPNICGTDGQNNFAIQTAGSGNVDIFGGKFQNLEEVVRVDNGSGDVVLKDSNIQNCSFGVHVLRGSVVSGVRVLNNVGAHTHKWYIVEVDAKCTNCAVNGNDLIYARSWIWQCENCHIENNRIFIPVVSGDTDWFNAIIGCGGWRPTTIPAPETVPNSEKFGCQSCKIDDNQISVGEYGNAAENSFCTMIGIICQYCAACSITRCNVDMNDFQSAALFAGKSYVTTCIASSYCEQCTYKDIYYSRASLGSFVCDIWDDNQFCKNSTIFDCASHGCYYCYCGQRCLGISYDRCTAANGVVGWFISEGAIGTVLNHCQGNSMTHAGVWNCRASAGGTVQVIITDPFLAPPVKTVVRNSTFIETVNGIYAGDVGATAGDGTAYGMLDNNIVIP